MIWLEKFLLRLFKIKEQPKYLGGKNEVD